MLASLLVIAGALIALGIDGLLGTLFAARADAEFGGVRRLAAVGVDEDVGFRGGGHDGAVLVLCRLASGVKGRAGPWRRPALHRAGHCRGCGKLRWHAGAMLRQIDD
jgi:hypothetical protein